MKLLADAQNIGVRQKYRRTIESWWALKSQRLEKISAEKFGGPLTIWARRNLKMLTFFLLVWLVGRATLEYNIDDNPTSCAISCKFI